MKLLRYMVSCTRMATLRIWTIQEHSIPLPTESTHVVTSSEIGTRISPPSVTASYFHVDRYFRSMSQERFQKELRLMASMTADKLSGLLSARTETRTAF